MSNQQHKISVNLMGELSICVNDTVVSKPLMHSKKLRGVAQYLLFHADRPVTHTELYEVFWPDEKSTNPRAALKTLIHRLRNALIQGGAPKEIDFILVRPGSYQWNPALDTSIDVRHFENLKNKLQQSDLEPELRLEYLYDMMELYRGKLFNDNEFWMVAPSTYIHACYLSAAEELCQLLKDAERHEEIVAVCRQVLDSDELEETVNSHLILALVALGRIQEAKDQYRSIKERYYNEYGVQVSEEMRELYRRIAETDQAIEMDIDNVRNALAEKESSARGAYVCEYGIFQDIYRIEERSLSRYGGRMFLALLTVTNKDFTMPGQRVLTKAMDQLLTAAATNLRSCDVVSRYSPAQYVLLLPTVTYETGQMVLDRICRAFRKANPRSPVVISTKLRPLRPRETSPSERKKEESDLSEV